MMKSMALILLMKTEVEKFLIAIDAEIMRTLADRDTLPGLN